MNTTPSNILVINCGSSSIKFAVINPTSEQALITGIAERLGETEAQLVWRASQQKHTTALETADHDLAMQAILTLLAEQQLADTLIAIGHRVVHGGEAFTHSTVINEEVKQAIADCQPLAPLHNPANLLGITITEKYFGQLPQVAVFDTAFHQTMPAKAYLYAIPYRFYKEKSVRRYGFHGTSYRYVAEAACQQLGIDYQHSHLLCAHLGNGCSAVAVSNGQAVDTTMGLTPLEGLVMGTRSGNLDPNLFSFLADEYGYSLEDISRILNKESGLLGLSELSNDMRALEEAASQGNQQAQLAVSVFCYQLAKTLGGLATALPRLDGLVFTGGIGENSSFVRQQVIKQLAILGFTLDEQANQQHGNKQGVITQPGSTCALVVKTDEELMIARDTASLVNQAPATSEH
ncbi:acetate/propionate family kinase [Spartinivicinus poritis]|uniref:Acetate kinase n=1 Tax=Spartinivicinus poritis TaxID=2994640 RepID=A0ABT5U8I0_9GAMM|nr:acetate kinase [Spartinivicinus sp. A2-2]MDE1462680.1 acetate kinase [Spartinivicinus sp. A2-2]